MAYSEKVCTGHERLTAQWPCAHAYTLCTSQSRTGLGAWPAAFDRGPSQTLPRCRRRRGANTEGARTEAPKAWGRPSAG